MLNEIFSGLTALGALGTAAAVWIGLRQIRAAEREIEETKRTKPRRRSRTTSRASTAASSATYRRRRSTSTASWSGEQDLSVPNTSTDCRIGVPGVLPSRANEVRAAELQLLSSRPRVIGAQAED